MTLGDKLTQRQIPARAINNAKRMHDQAVIVFNERYPRWYVAERMNKITAFASIPESTYQERLFWNSLRMFFIHEINSKPGEIMGLKVKEKISDGHRGTEVQILFSDHQGTQQLLRTFKAGATDYFKCEILPFLNFAVQEPLVDEIIRSPAAGRIRVEDAFMNTSVGTLSYKADTASIRFTSTDERIVCIYDLETNKLFIDPKDLNIRNRILEMFMEAMSDAAMIGRRYGFMQLEQQLRHTEPVIHTTLVTVSPASNVKN